MTVAKQENLEIERLGYTPQQEARFSQYVEGRFNIRLDKLGPSASMNQLKQEFDKIEGKNRNITFKLAFDFFRAIAEQESKNSGSYAALGEPVKGGKIHKEGDRAIGKHQIMPVNWIEWAGENVAPTSVMQDIVAFKRLTEYLNNWLDLGNTLEEAQQLTSAKWYGNNGRDLISRSTKKGDIDRISRTKPKGQRRAPSPREYADSILYRLKNLSPAEQSIYYNSPDAVLLYSGMNKRETWAQELLRELDADVKKTTTQREIQNHLQNVLASQEIEKIYSQEVQVFSERRFREIFNDEKIREITELTRDELVELAKSENEEERREFVEAMRKFELEIENFIVENGGQEALETLPLDPHWRERNTVAMGSIGWYFGAISSGGNMKSPLIGALAMGLLGFTDLAGPLTGIVSKVVHTVAHVSYKADAGYINLLRNLSFGGEWRNLETGNTQSTEARKMIAEGFNEESLDRFRNMSQFVAPEIRGFFRDKILDYTPPSAENPREWTKEEIHSAAKFCVRSSDKSIYSAFGVEKGLDSFHDWSSETLKNVEKGFVTIEAGMILRHFLVVESRSTKVEGENKNAREIFIEEFSSLLTEKKKQDVENTKKTLKAYLQKTGKEKLIAFSEEELQEMFSEVDFDRLAIAQDFGFTNFMNGGARELAVHAGNIMTLVFGLLYGIPKLAQMRDGAGSLKDNLVDKWQEGAGKIEKLPIKTQNKLSALLMKQNPDAKDVHNFLDILVIEGIINNQVRKGIWKEINRGNGQSFFSELNTKGRFKGAFVGENRDIIARRFREDIKGFSNGINEKNWDLSQLRASYKSFSNRLHPKGGLSAKIKTKEGESLSLTDCKKLVPAEISAGGLTQWMVDTTARIPSLGLKQKDIFRAQSMNDKNITLVMTRNPNGKVYVHKLVGSVDPKDPLGKRRLWLMKKRYEVEDMQLG